MDKSARVSTVSELTFEDVASLPTQDDYRKGKAKPLLMTPAARAYFIKHLGYGFFLCQTKKMTLTDAKKFVKWYKEEYKPSCIGLS